jgi:Flp pilus assembly pilin Flp
MKKKEKNINRTERMTASLHSLERFQRNEKGATAVLVAVLLIVLLSFAALAIDIGYLTVTRNQLQNVSDAAALAGARQLGILYGGIDGPSGIEPMSYEEQQVYDCTAQLTYQGSYSGSTPANDCELILASVKDAAIGNSAAGKNIEVRDEDIAIGVWAPDASGAMLFTQTTLHPDAVRVVARRDASENGPIRTFFANIFGVDTMNVSATATASLNGPCEAGPAELELPIGIPQSRGPEDCGKEIKFSPPTDIDTCGGWTDFQDDASVPDPNLRNLLNGSTESPQLKVGEDEITFNNGSLSNPTFETLLDRFGNEGFDVDEEGNPRIDADGNPVGPEVDSGIGPDGTSFGPAVPLTESTPSYDLPEGADRTPVDAANPQLRYPPCSGGSSCSGPPRYKHEWHTSVVVYGSDTCAPNTTYPITGFAEIRVKDVLLAPDKLIQGEMLCGYVSPGNNRGGCSPYGVKGSIPGLVQ